MNSCRLEYAEDSVICHLVAVSTGLVKMLIFRVQPGKVRIIFSGIIFKEPFLIYILGLSVKMEIRSNEIGALFYNY